MRVSPELLASKDALITLVRTIPSDKPVPSRLLHPLLDLTDPEFRKLAAYLTERKLAFIGSNNQGFFWAPGSAAKRKKLKHLLSRLNGLKWHIKAVIEQIRADEAQERAAAGHPDPIQETLKLEIPCSRESQLSARKLASP